MKFILSKQVVLSILFAPMCMLGEDAKAATIPEDCPTVETIQKYLEITQGAVPDFDPNTATLKEFPLKKVDSKSHNDPEKKLYWELDAVVAGKGLSPTFSQVNLSTKSAEKQRCIYNAIYKLQVGAKAGRALNLEFKEAVPK